MHRRYFYSLRLTVHEPDVVFTLDGAHVGVVIRDEADTDLIAGGRVATSAVVHVAVDRDFEVKPSLAWHTSADCGTGVGEEALGFVIEGSEKGRLRESCDRGVGVVGNCEKGL